MRKAWEERMRHGMKHVNVQKNSRGHNNDRGEQMRRAMGEWVERMREMREHSRDRDDDERETGLGAPRP